MHLNRYFAIIPTLILLLASSPMMTFAADWLNDAFRLMRAQPYIGAAFFNGLYTSSSKTLIQQNATICLVFDSISNSLLKKVITTRSDSPFRQVIPISPKH